jgi:hypothetical protein
MKPGESTGELLARITNTMVIIKDSYASYENKPPAPANFDVNNGFTMPVCRQWKDDVLNNTQQFLKMQLFWAALMPELRKVVAQRNPNTMTLDDMYQIATDTQWEARPKIKQAVTAVQPEDDDDEVAAFQRRKNKNFDRKKPLPQTLIPNPDRRDTPATTEAIQGPETMPTEMGNIASTTNYRTIPRMNVSKEFGRRNLAEIDKAGPTGPECT